LEPCERCGNEIDINHKDFNLEEPEVCGQCRRESEYLHTQLEDD
jgi:hypothetical protein